jgi:hypothetical protein
MADSGMPSLGAGIPSFAPPPPTLSRTMRARLSVIHTTLSDKATALSDKVRRRCALL